jgi:CheY-like chemotaxis protein
MAYSPPIKSVERYTKMQNSQSILVVDDYDQIRSILCQILQHAGYEVFEAANGRQAIDKLRESTADLVITDLIMPEQGGLETIRSLRNERPDLKIIAMSGGQCLGVAKKMGADRTLRKPLHAETVLEAVRELLG